MRTFLGHNLWWKLGDTTSRNNESTGFSESANMGHRSIANTVVYTAVADKRIRNIWST
jgi:hypothetical protein